MEKATVIVIGGGATGVGILRDLVMRGVDALLLEMRDLVHGTSSRYHGLLHSGARYAVKDSDAGRECIEENMILRKIGRHCVEATEGFFVRLPEDDPAYEQEWVEACKTINLPAIQIDPAEAWYLEPNLTHRAQSVYRVPDAAIDGFRMAWQNVDSAKKYGGRVKTYTEVVRINSVNGQVISVTVRNFFTKQEYDIECEFVVNAAGPWAGKVAGCADLMVNVQPDRGTLIAFNHRLTNRVINRLHKSSDGDIFVPHGSITILGTTSASVESPDDTQPLTSEVEYLLRIGELTFENLRNFRILRAFCGARPLYSADPNAKGRGASRGFVVLDHEYDGLKGFVSICGGKFTTYRMMAEQLTDLVCKKLHNEKPCRTAIEPLVEDISPQVLAKARQYFPNFGVNLAASRLGEERLQEVINRMVENPVKSELVCECENVTMAEVEVAAEASTSYTLGDIRRKTRMGMGTCQGAFCTFRGMGMVAQSDLVKDQDTLQEMKDFLQSRYKGISPALWGSTIREVELMRGIYDGVLNLDGEIFDEKN